MGLVNSVCGGLYYQKKRKKKKVTFVCVFSASFYFIAVIYSFLFYSFFFLFFIEENLNHPPSRHYCRRGKTKKYIEKIVLRKNPSLSPYVSSSPRKGYRSPKKRKGKR
eukprot:TRINITY_DN474_c1_g1_i1.p1 TRINITY_DN474_c1_g1~~TRINITY_DN474_c1_g1_i1.p1  ORF type:complete len:108 (-),score=2.16 TRINITY_DN474_c1_g1_i1:98-421(-)